MISYSSQATTRRTEKTYEAIILEEDTNSEKGVSQQQVRSLELNLTDIFQNLTRHLFNRCATENLVILFLLFLHVRSVWGHVVDVSIDEDEMERTFCKATITKKSKALSETITEKKKVCCSCGTYMIQDQPIDQLWSGICGIRNCNTRILRDVECMSTGVVLEL